MNRPRIIRHAERKEERIYDLLFERIDPGSDLAFPCDEQGYVDKSKLQPAGLRNYELATGDENHLYKQPPVVRYWTRRWTEPLVIECFCGHELECPEFTNTCVECGRDYNSSGQPLAPRSQWGWDTGESVNDILDIGHYEG